MAEIVWTTPAFLVLEALPEDTAFGIIRQTDLLRKFPQMGSQLSSRFRSLQNYRQLVFRRRLRVIYEYNELENCVYLLLIQDCRQKLPTARDLKRDKGADDELSSFVIRHRLVFSRLLKINGKVPHVCPLCCGRKANMTIFPFPYAVSTSAAFPFRYFSPSIQPDSKASFSA